VFWTDGQYFGPAAIVNAHRFIFDSRDDAGDVRLDILNDKEGVWRCRTTFNCTDACPRGIQVTQAIADVKQAILRGRLTKWRLSRPADLAAERHCWPWRDSRWRCLLRPSRAIAATKTYTIGKTTDIKVGSASHMVAGVSVLITQPKRTSSSGCLHTSEQAFYCAGRIRLPARCRLRFNQRLVCQRPSEHWLEGLLLFQARHRRSRFRTYSQLARRSLQLRKQRCRADRLSARPKKSWPTPEATPANTNRFPGKACG
jgi:hypothetical protein